MSASTAVESVTAGSQLTTWDELFGTRCNGNIRARWITGTGSDSYEVGWSWGLPSWSAWSNAHDSAVESARRAAESWVDRNCPGFCPQGCECRYLLVHAGSTPSYSPPNPPSDLGWGGTWTWQVYLLVFIECWKA